jgi:hypothetical protein
MEAKAMQARLSIVLPDKWRTLPGAIRVIADEQESYTRIGMHARSVAFETLSISLNPRLHVDQDPAGHRRELRVDAVFGSTS